MKPSRQKARVLVLPLTTKGTAAGLGWDFGWVVMRVCACESHEKTHHTSSKPRTPDKHRNILLYYETHPDSTDLTRLECSVQGQATLSELVSELPTFDFTAVKTYSEGSVLPLGSVLDSL